MGARIRATQATVIGVAVICKCLACKETFTLEGVTFDITDVLDDDYEFERYNIKISGPLGPIHPETELCFANSGYRMSVYGVMSNGTQFAFPCLQWSAVRDSNLWLSSPDSKGAHMAVLPASGAAT